MTDRDLIYLAALHITKLELTTDHPLAIMFNRFKSLTENRSELVQKCVEAVTPYCLMYVQGSERAKEDAESGIRAALTQVLNPENTRHESAKTGVEEIIQAIRNIEPDENGLFFSHHEITRIRTALTKLLEK